MKKMKILITGGLGFIFSYVTEFYVKKGYDVVVIDNQTDGSHPEIIDGSFHNYNLDVSDPTVMKIIGEHEPDYIIHAAAISDVDYSIRNPYQTLQKNIISNLNIFEAARKLPNLKKFVYVSTDEVYGECEHPKREDEIIFPRNPYSCSKAVGSLFRITFDNTYVDLKNKTAETRFCNVFGPRQDSRKILPAIKECLERGSSLPLHGAGLGYREYLYVKNIPEVVDLILKKGDRTYNVTLNEGFTVADLIKKTEQISGKKVLTHESDRPGMDLKYQMDNAKIMELGWKPLYTFDQGLTEYLCEK